MLLSPLPLRSMADKRRSADSAGAPLAPLQRDLRVAAADAFTHPEATHAILLGGRQIAYALRRSARRSIGFMVDSCGLTVYAPQHASMRTLESALHDKARWILAKLTQAHEKSTQQHAAQVQWQDGAVLPFLGAPLTLQLTPVTARRTPPTLLPGGARVLQLGLPPTALPAQIQRATQIWLMGQARRVFTERLDHFAPQVGVHWQRMSLSAARTRWGSANQNGVIRLNWRLIHFPLRLIDSVVVHELAHLLEMNHSARFWAHVARVLPDHAARREALKHAVAPPW